MFVISVFVIYSRLLSELLMTDPRILELDKIEEENKASSQFALYSKGTHANPLVYNKGSPKKNNISTFRHKLRKFTTSYEIKKEARGSFDMGDTHIVSEFNLVDNDTNINKILNLLTFKDNKDIGVSNVEEDTILIENEPTIEMEYAPRKSASMLP
jgi:hypothetical protein